MNPKSTIEEYRRLIEQEIAGIPVGDPAGLYEPIRYLMQLGGKRLRPLLTLLGYNLFKRSVKTAVPYAVAVEVFHNFTLMHDDIMDQSSIRRGKPTVHKKWDVPTAILSGDAMLVKVYERFNGLPAATLKPVLRAFNACALGVCEGQHLDMDFEKRNRVTEAEYLQMIRLKTAVLLGFSLQLGALLAGAPKRSQQALYDFGVDMGIGFQLTDDLLDAYGDPSQVGKQKGGDILTNKKTLLLIKALDATDADSKKELKDWLSAKEFDPAGKIEAVLSIFDRLKVREAVEKKTAEVFAHGFNRLARIRGAGSRQQVLVNFARSLIARQS